MYKFILFTGPVYNDAAVVAAPQQQLGQLAAALAVAGVAHQRQSAS